MTTQASGPEIHIVESFALECGATLRSAPVAYQSWGTLNAARDNVLVVCHVFSEDANVEEWWGPLLGPGRALDPTRFFIFCGNVLGSPFGSASPLTIDPATGAPYGPTFPPTSIRDDVRIHKCVLDALGATGVAAVIGGSMGGLASLEWPLCTPPGYVRRIVSIAGSACQSAWGIGWGEAQRAIICGDPAFADGRYTAQPIGLAAARVCALLTCRSRASLEGRFGRAAQPPAEGDEAGTDATPGAPAVFAVQSYLRHQGAKFAARFDANCYISLTRKMDTHDVARGRGGDARGVLARLPRALVLSIPTDVLYVPAEQHMIADAIPGAQFADIDSPDGHAGFMLEAVQVEALVLRFLQGEFPELYST